jgi:hypothetical protein
MNTLIEIPLKSALILATMSIDNYFWITDSPEWKSIKKNFKLVTIKGFNIPIPINKDGFSYIFFKRIVPVWSNWRDITPAIIGGGLLSIIT